MAWHGMAAHGMAWHISPEVLSCGEVHPIGARGELLPAEEGRAPPVRVGQPGGQLRPGLGVGGQARGQGSRRGGGRGQG